MGNKKHDREVEADFFGDDDLGWLDDDEQDEGSAAEKQSASKADTVLFSSQATLPPGPATTPPTPPPMAPPALPDEAPPPLPPSAAASPDLPPPAPEVAPAPAPPPLPVTPEPPVPPPAPSADPFASAPATSEPVAPPAGLPAAAAALPPPFSARPQPRTAASLGAEPEPPKAPAPPPPPPSLTAASVVPSKPDDVAPPRPAESPSLSLDPEVPIEHDAPNPFAAPDANWLDTATDEAFSIAPPPAPVPQSRESEFRTFDLAPDLLPDDDEDDAPLPPQDDEPTANDETPLDPPFGEIEEPTAVDLQDEPTFSDVDDVPVPAANPFEAAAPAATTPSLFAPTPPVVPEAPSNPFEASEPVAEASPFEPAPEHETITNPFESAEPVAAANPFEPAPEPVPSPFEPSQEPAADPTPPLESSSVPLPDPEPRRPAAPNPTIAFAIGSDDPDDENPPLPVEEPTATDEPEDEDPRVAAPTVAFTRAPVDEAAPTVPFAVKAKAPEPEPEPVDDEPTADEPIPEIEPVTEVEPELVAAHDDAEPDEDMPELSEETGPEVLRPLPEAVTARPTPPPTQKLPTAEGPAPVRLNQPTESFKVSHEPARARVVGVAPQPRTSIPERSAPPSPPTEEAPSLKRGATPATAPRLPDVQPATSVSARPKAPQATAPLAQPRKPNPDAWRKIISLLVAEYGAEDLRNPSSTLDKSIYLERATRIAAHQVGDLERAVELYERAREAGRKTSVLLRTHAEVLGRLHRYSEQLTLLAELGDMLEGPARAGALLEAGLVAWRRLNQPEDAVQHLRRAAAAEPRNYTARALLRALLPRIPGVDPAERLKLLDELAELGEGGIAADMYVEAATVADEAGDAKGGRQRLRKALAAEPGHTSAFLRLEQALFPDPPALAELYRTEANRPGQIEAGWWHAEAARAYQRAGMMEEAVAGFNAAVSGGYPYALRELQGGYIQNGSWTELEDALSREADALGPEDGQAYTLYRLGWLRESRLDAPQQALESYRRAADADPASAPAADAVARLLRDDPNGRREFWKLRHERATLPAERRYLALQLAEAADLASDHTQAKTLYQQVLEGDRQDTAAEVAVGGLERLLLETGDRPGLSALRRAQAQVTENPSERALFLREAANPPPPPPSDPGERDAAISDLQLALDAEPDSLSTLAQITVLLHRAEDWRKLAEVLRSAGSATDDQQRRAAHLYRAGRIFADRVRDDATARTCLRQALLADPTFRPARWLLRAVSGPSEAAGDANVYREEAKHAEGRSERAWGLFAAAEASGPGPAARRDLQRILTDNPDHLGALAALEVQCIADGDEEALTQIYLRSLEGAPTTTKARIGARAAVLLARSGKAARALEVLRRIHRMPVEGSPLRACARMALRLGAQDLALELLEGLDTVEDAGERARLEAAAGRPSEALPRFLSLIDRAGEPLGVAARAAAMAQQIGDNDAMLRAYSTIARQASKSPLSAAYGSWTGMNLQSNGNDAEALEFWLISHRAAPGSQRTLEGVIRGLVANADTEGLMRELANEPPEGLAEALADAGQPGQAAAALYEALPTFADDPARTFVATVLLEQLFEEAGDWPMAYDMLTRRRASTNDPRTVGLADDKIRFVLAEHLPETDAAWELYRQLHDASPADRDVTESLARIAGARGEVGMAIEFLNELSETATSAPESARYQRRIGEVYERANQPKNSRDAYLRALEYVPNDTDALGGLKRLAEQQQDWPELVNVLTREASLAEGLSKLELRRRIAQVIEDHMDRVSEAMDAWRAVVDLSPRDEQALRHLLELSEQSAQWEVFVTTGESLAELLSGPDRAALLRRVGIACEDHLGRSDAAVFYQKAVAVVPPDAIAAQRLEKAARSRADWSAAVRALSLQAEAEIADDERVAALRAAAEIEVELRHDRESAAQFYRRILDLEPTHEPSLRFMAQHLFEAGQYAQAMPICQRLEPVVERGQDLDDFDVRMDLSNFYFSFAEMLRFQGDHSEALPRYERTLELNPTHLPSLEAVGPLYTESEQWKQAERVYRSLLQLSGGTGDRQKVATTYTALGLVERRLGNTDKAYKRFNKALELHANHVGALKGMALVLEDRADWSNLLNVYNNIIYHASVPEDVVDAYMTKGRILDVQLDRQDKAAQHYQRSLDFDPNQPVALLRLAELAMRRNAYREAGDLAEKALQLDADLVQPHRAPLLLVRAAAWQSVGRTKEAERCLREARVLDSGLVRNLGDEPLADLNGLREAVYGYLP
ncbi:MAG: tetratricopeptide repeat protein [Myxococcota bacterium]